MDQFNIPETVNIGYQERKDTYTDRLAFITYKDTLGNLKSENSWNKWRDNDIEPDVISNIPRTGFVLNKNGGGDGWGYYDRAEFVRVYDPHGFEIEISIDNLLKIITYNGISKGNGIEGELVYAWEKNKRKLSLLPVTSEEYIHITKNKVDLSNITIFKKKEIKVGNTYLFKDTMVLTYLGKHNVFTGYDKKDLFIFVNNDGKYQLSLNLNRITHLVSENKNIDTLLDNFNKSVFITGLQGTYTFTDSIENKSIRTEYSGFYKINNDICFLYMYHKNKYHKFINNEFIEVEVDNIDDILNLEMYKQDVTFTFLDGYITNDIYSPMNILSDRCNNLQIR